MAGLAFGRHVPSPQRILRVQVVVECDGLPITLPVTGFAFVTVCSFMLVVFLMTGITIRWGIFKSRRLVALLAFYGGMFPHKRKTRLIVVERRLLP